MSAGVMRKLIAMTIASLALAGLAAKPSRAEERPAGKYVLKQGWAIQSSEKVKETGEELATAGFQAQGWYPASIPSTVLAALVANGVYPDPFFGMNLRQVPGNLPPPLDVSASRPELGSPFRKAWWYRTEFEVPADFQGKKIWLHFGGLNFRARVWLNGRRLAEDQDAAGAYRVFEFEITELARPGEVNALAVEIIPPRKSDLAFTWVDWNPAPPDRNMGLWREVYLTASGPVTLRFPQVITKLDLPSLETAHLTVLAVARNASDQAVTGTVQGRIGDIAFSREVTLAPEETREVTFAPDQYAQLNIAKPKLWWPSQLGPQNLHDLSLEFVAEGRVSDRLSSRFGIREISSELNASGGKQFKINGQNILIRGAGWTPDMMLRFTPERLEAEVRYVKEMNLNTIRLEGKLEQDLFYDLCDRYGVLVLAGWCCCDHWERWYQWDDEDYRVSENSLRDQIRRLRIHPCLLAWMNGSDHHPTPKVESTYLKVLEEQHWPNPIVSSATEAPSQVSGPSGVKMTGPYEWVPPIYWYSEKRRGGARQFNTETSPGPAVPPVESLRQMLPAEHLWPIDEVWNYHCARGQFGNLHVFTKALEARYGTATGLEDYAKKSQAMTYEGERAMFEAFAKNKYEATGVIQWMLNNAWPSLVWHLYDYYLRPAGGYFGARKACEPLHVQYSYDDRSVVVVNGLYREFNDLKVSAKILNLDLAEKFSREQTVQAAPDSVTQVLTLPKPLGLTATYFLALELEDADGQVQSSNFYWLSTKNDVLNKLLPTWYYTPTLAYSDFQGLQDLPAVNLKVSATFDQDGSEGAAHVSLENPSRSLAFMVRLKVTRGGGGEEVLPIFWQDNYFSLLPGQKKEVAGRYRLSDLGSARPALAVEGWNVPAKSFP